MGRGGRGELYRGGYYVQMGRGGSGVLCTNRERWEWCVIMKYKF